MPHTRNTNTHIETKVSLDVSLFLSLFRSGRLFPFGREGGVEFEMDDDTGVNRQGAA